MANLTVSSTPVDDFMQSASKPAAANALGVPYVYATVAALTGDANVTAFEAGDTVQLNGYYAAGDFGKPITLIIEASTGGVKSHTLSDGRYANLYAKGWVDIRWFGAKGDTSHTLLWTAASNGPTTEAEPTGTNDTQAFKDAITGLTSTGGDIIIPDTGNWYKVYAGILSAKTDRIIVPPNVNLKGNGKIYVWGQGDTMFGAAYNGVTGRTPAAGYAGSRGFELQGNNTIEGLTFDGGAQEEPVYVTGSEQIYFATINTDGSADNHRTLTVKNCRFYNACGSHITGDANECDDVVISDCYFYDYKDHAVYIPGKRVLISDCHVIGEKDDTTRQAFKTISKNDNTFKVDSCSFILTNGTGLTFDGRGTADAGTDETGNSRVCSVTNCTFTGDQFIDSVWAGGSDAVYDDVYVAGNQAVCTGYGINVGQIASSANVKRLRIENNYIEYATSNIIASGGTNAAGDQASRKLIVVDIINNEFKVTAAGYEAVRTAGSIDYFTFRGNSIILGVAGETDTGVVTNRTWAGGFNYDDSVWVLENNHAFAYDVLLEFKDISASVTSMPIDISIRGNKLSADGPSQYIQIEDTGTNYGTSAWNKPWDIEDCYSRHVLDAATVRTLNSTPLTLAPAVYAGSYNIFEELDFWIDYGSVAFAGANNLEFRYTDGAGTKVCGDIPAATLNSTADTPYIPESLATPIAPELNTPIVAFVPTANPSGGTGSTVYLTLKYRIVKP